jgi:hypothetical protein
MKILHTITTSTYCPSRNAWEQGTRHIIRSKRLTYTGAARILRRDGFTGEVVHIETAIFSR